MRSLAAIAVSVGLFAAVLSMDEFTTPEPKTTTQEDTSGRLLTLPVPEKCANRPVHFTFDDHAYFYSGSEEVHKDDKVDWLKARNHCREYCMDLVSIESPSENDMVEEFIQNEDLPYIWTSGRLCNFKGCEARNDLKPFHVNGWFWSGSGVKMAPTNATPPGWPYQPWSFTGHKTHLEGRNVPQPDNAEFDINESVEACMGILNDIYEDGVKWHDIACYHTKPYLCEDSDQLLDYVESTNPELDLSLHREDPDVDIGPEIPGPGLDLVGAGRPGVRPGGRPGGRPDGRPGGRPGGRRN